MSRLDRYLIQGMLGPFLFGMGAFMVLLLGIDVLYHALELIVDRRLPVGPVLTAMAYRLPQTVLFTLPMATIFAALMNLADLSGHGEVVALRAGGVGIPRLALPTLALGFCISLVAMTLNVWVIPHANAASGRILAELGERTLETERYITIRVPDEGPPERVIFADRFDPNSETILMLLIWEFRQGVPQEFYSAERAGWSGTSWVLEGVKHVRQLPNGDRTTQEFDRLEYQHLGVTPWEVARQHKLPQDLTTSELLQMIELNRGKGGKAEWMYVEELHVRFSFPWSALGLALIGLPLGLRPQRTSTGVGLGISLAVLFVYYTLMSMMRVMGQEGALHPAIADWVPNFLLYTIGAGLLINASR